MSGVLMLLSFIAFISLGMPDGLLGVAWPWMRADFAQPIDALGILLIASVVGYTLSSFFSGWISAKMGIGRLLAASCAATALALFGYTIIPSWFLVIPFGLFSGLGAGAIDAGLNAYFERHHGERLMQWLHASFGIGITFGPFIMTWAVTVLGVWRTGYRIVAAFQFVLAVLFFFTSRMWEPGAVTGAAAGRSPAAETEPVPDAPCAPLEPSHPHASGGGSGEARESSGTIGTVPARPFRATLAHGRSWLSASLFFIYAGMEANLGYWAFSFLTEARGIDAATAGAWTGSYWASFTIGRIIAGFVAHRIRPAAFAGWALVCALAGALVILAGTGVWASLAGIAVFGIAIAPIFPALVSSTNKRVGIGHTANTVGMQMAFAGMGVAVVPSVTGIAAAAWGVGILPAVLVATSVVLIALHSASLALGRRTAG